MDASEQVKLLQRQLGGKDKALQTRSENAELLEQERANGAGGGGDLAT